MNTTKSPDRYLPLEAAAEFLHIKPERIDALKERGVLKIYGKKDSEERFCKLSELKKVTFSDIMDVLYGPADEESEEGYTVEYELQGYQRESRRW